MAEENSPQEQQQNQEKQTQQQEQKTEVKFTQEDLNKLLQDRLATEKTKHQKELDDLKAQMTRDAELSKMNEQERIKAELEDYKAKFQKSQDEIALNLQTEQTRGFLKEANLSNDFLKFVLVPKDENQTKANIQNLKTVFDAEVKKGVEAQIKPHKPGNVTNIVATGNGQQDKRRSYSGFNLQNSVAEFYNKN